ncbi:MAG: hypothetical protein JOZ81_28710, partial [Chloroflexi bacterium]|nr:hypothetical protein [Chloroflexota bacterium]
AEYAESKINTHLEHVDVQTDGSVCLDLRDRATVPLELSWFRDASDGVERTFATVEPVDGRRSVRLARPA